MESPLAAIETNRNIEQETPRIAAVDKDQHQVVRKLLGFAKRTQFPSLSSWRGVPANRPTCLCFENDSQLTPHYL